MLNIASEHPYVLSPAHAAGVGHTARRKTSIATLLHSLYLGSGLLPLSLYQVPHAHAAEATETYNIPAASLEDALNAFARKTGITLSFDPALVKGRISPPLQGELTRDQAIHQLLKGTDLEPVTQDGATIIRRKPAASISETLPEVAVVAEKETADSLGGSYAGNQVAIKGGLGLLGNKGFMDTPFNQTSYTSKTIEDFQARSLSDLLIADPSVRLSSARTNINEDFSIRGLTVAGQDIAINGMYGLAPYFRTPIEFIERVEVLKGPSALLNGMSPGGNVGGNINVLPKRAGDDPLTRVTASYLSDSVFGSHVDIGRRFGENKEFGIRFNGAYRDGDTRLDHQSQEETLGSLALDYKGEKLRVTFDHIYQQQNIHGVTRQFTVGSLLTEMPNAPDATTNYPGYGYSKMKDRTQILRAEYDISDHISIYGGYGTRKSRMDAVAGNPVLTDSAGNFTSSPAWQLFNIDSRSMEAGVKARFNTGNIGHSISLGMTRVVQDQYIFFYTAFAGRNSNLYSPVYSSTPSTDAIEADTTKYASTTLTSYALADTLSFMDDRIQLTLGLRHQNVYTPSYVFGTGARVGEAYDESAVTPLAGIVIKPWQNTSLYANYIQGLSQGGTAPVGTTNSGQIFSPYKTRQKELGVKMDWGKIATTLSMFEIERPLSYTFNNTFSVDGEQKNRGIELNVFGEVIDHVRLLGGMAITRSRLNNTEGGAYDGNEAIAVPRVQANLGADWDVLAVQGLSLNARTVYTSKQYVDRANNLDIDSWTRFDLGARYKTVVQQKPVTFRANIENVFDKRYWSSSNEGYLYVGAPRTLLLSATVDF